MDDMDIDHIDENFDSPEARRAMRARHAQIALRMQAIAVYALEEMERKAAAGQSLGVSRAEAEKLREAGEKLERESHDGDDDSPKKPN